MGSLPRFSSRVVQMAPLAKPTNQLLRQFESIVKSMPATYPRDPRENLGKTLHSSPPRSIGAQLERTLRRAEAELRKRVWSPAVVSKLVEKSESLSSGEEAKIRRMTAAIPLLALHDATYYVFSAYARAAQLIPIIVSSTNRSQYVAAAVCGRALMELAAYLKTNAPALLDPLGETSMSLRAEQDAAPAAGEAMVAAKKATLASRLEKAKAIFGEKVNAVTVIGRLSRGQRPPTLLDFYNRLCDVAHPNFGSVNAVMVSQAPGAGRIDDLGLRARWGSRHGRPEMLRLIMPPFAWSVDILVGAFKDFGAAATELRAAVSP